MPKQYRVSCSKETKEKIKAIAYKLGMFQKATVDLIFKSIDLEDVPELRDLIKTKYPFPKGGVKDLFKS